ncbi:hypothetical protein BGY98DRAFT_1049238, partial [Russula aff. rugulosa BPL654]
MFLNRKVWPFYSHTREIECRCERYRETSFPPLLRLLYWQQQHCAFATFKDLLLFGNGEHPQLVQLEYFYKTLIESVLTNDNHSSSRSRCLPPFLKTLRVLRFPACPPQHPHCLPLTQAILLRARDGGQNYPHTSHQLLSTRLI